MNNGRYSKYVLKPDTRTKREQSKRQKVRKRKCYAGNLSPVWAGLYSAPDVCLLHNRRRTLPRVTILPAQSTFADKRGFCAINSYWRAADQN